MGEKNKRRLGADYEAVAAEYLKSKGMRIYDRNFRSRQGEIDLIGFIENQLVFIEVKYRKNDKIGFPEEAVGITKQKKISQVAAFFLYCHPEFLEMRIRYDVVAICGNELRWHPDAFPHCGQ